MINISYIPEQVATSLSATSQL